MHRNRTRSNLFNNVKLIYIYHPDRCESSKVVTINEVEDTRKRYTLDLTTPFIIPFALLSRGRQGYRDFRLLKVGIRQKLASSMRNSKVAANERHSRNTDISFHFFSREIDEPTSETIRLILLSIPIGKFLAFFF